MGSCVLRLKSSLTRASLYPNSACLLPLCIYDNTPLQCQISFFWTLKAQVPHQGETTNLPIVIVIVLTADCYCPVPTQGKDVSLTVLLFIHSQGCLPLCFIPPP